MKYIFGPVPSRRLGLSLGVDIVPLKSCTLSCVYCQVGKTPSVIVERKEYIPTSDILEELRGFFTLEKDLDWVTFSGSGEPTLHSGIGAIISGIKELSQTPVCVITNGTLLSDPAVRKDLLMADAVMPSLDSALEESFQRINKPHPSLTVEKIIDGLVSFRDEYSGKIWLEIMLVAGINDSADDIEALVRAAKKIRPDTIQLNTVVRPPAEQSAAALTEERMEDIRKQFGDHAEIIASFKTSERKKGKVGIGELRDYLKRRPGSVSDMLAALGIDEQTLDSLLLTLEDSGEIVLRDHRGSQYWEYIQDS